MPNVSVRHLAGRRRAPTRWRGEWLHKCASRAPSGTLEAVVEYPAGRDAQRYLLTIEEQRHRFRARDECIEDDVVNSGEERTRRHFGYRNGIGFLMSRDGGERPLPPKDIDSEQSILSGQVVSGPPRITAAPVLRSPPVATWYPAARLAYRAGLPDTIPFDSLAMVEVHSIEARKLRQTCLLGRRPGFNLSCPS